MKIAKKCTKCALYKSVDSFSMNGAKYRHSACKECRSLARVRINDTPRGLAYTRWQCMKLRCYGGVPKNRKYYSEKGIVVCDRWLEFENFLADMGYPPGPEYQLDRIDSRGIYEHANCRWATPSEQSRNRPDRNLIEISGRSQLLSDWAKESGLDLRLIYGRMKRGLVGEALLRPIKTKYRHVAP